MSPSLIDVRPTAPAAAPVSAERRWPDLVLLGVLCGVLFFYGLNAGQLYRTEGLRAILAQEMLRSGDWVVPNLYGDPFLTKPPGMYAAIALGSWPVGHVTEWSARLPSALAASATVFLVYWFFGQQLGRRGGLVAALILPMSFLWLDKATAAEIDMLQVFWVTAAILFFFRALEGEESVSVVAYRLSSESSIQNPPFSRVKGQSEALRWWLLALICVAGGVLTKWTAPAFFYLTAVPLLWRRGQLRLLWQRHHLAGVLLAGIICAAWVAAVTASVGWRALFDTVTYEARVHLTGGGRAYPPGQRLVHPFKVLGANLPWSAVALVTLWPGFRLRCDPRGRRLLQALHCWVWPSLLFWSLVPQHSTRHSFPIWPALAGLAAVVRVTAGSGRLPRMRWLASPRLLTACVIAWIAVKLVFVQVVVPARDRGREPREKGQHLASLVPAGAPLYVCQLKDEGLMFYYGRPVHRVARLDQLPSSPEPVYGILQATEWQDWGRFTAAEVVERMQDEQGAPILLVRSQSPTPPRTEP